jgi:hypothetical protein
MFGFVAEQKFKHAVNEIALDEVDLRRLGKFFDRGEPKLQRTSSEVADTRR